MGYIAPFYKQAKTVAWTYLKDYSMSVPGSTINESELRVDYLNGGQVRLYGADNPDALRGIYLDDVTLDEPADMSPRLWPEIIRPTLVDRKGRASFIGTPKGKNSFYDICAHAKANPKDWLHMVLRASETHLIDPEELLAARQMMTENQYEQEFECSFDAAIQGAVYGQWISNAEKSGRVKNNLYDPLVLVNTAWDLGYDDSTAIWFWQRVGSEIRIIDYYENNGQDVPHYCGVITERGYKYSDHFVPHDARNKLLAAGGKSIVEQAYELGVKMVALPPASQQNLIEATRKTIGQCWFSEDKCSKGIEALKQYRYDFDDEKKAFRSVPRHDWSSHAADAFEIIAQVREMGGGDNKPRQPRFLNEMTADELFWPQTPDTYQDEG